MRWASFGERLRLDREELLYAAVILNTELLVLLLYVWWDAAIVRRPLYYVYPFVWLNAALWGVTRVSPSSADRRRRLIAGGIAAAYLAVLAVAGGLVGPGGPPATGFRLVLTSLPPGWAPALLYSGTAVQFALLPFKVVGYAALAYLVYATLLDAASSVAGGLLGLFSCVSCVLPVVAGVLSGFLGAGGALVSAAYGQSYWLSTTVYVVTVALLVWRPSVADLARWR